MTIAIRDSAALSPGRATSNRLLALALLLLVGIASRTADAQFIHPGGLLTQSDLDRIKTEVAAGAHPWVDDWNLLVTDPLAQNTYKAGPRANLGSNRQRADKDAHAAFLNALRWYVTGDKSYADCAVRILNAWAATVNQVPTMPPPDVYGLQAISMQDFALAAEVLRLYPGWAPADIATFKNMLVQYFYPAVHVFLTQHDGACISYYWANWDAANIGALIAMGVFDDNVDWFNEGVDYFRSGPGNGSIKNAVYHRWSRLLGQWNESGRDQEHAQLGVGLLGYAAQVAWNQGVDLFSEDGNALLAGGEYVARYNMDEEVPYKTYNNCTDVRQFWPAQNGRGRLDDRPIWELLYNHYAVIEGLDTPNVKAMAELMRPEHGSVDHFGYGTLLFTLKPTDSPYPPAPVPQAPTGLRATAGVGVVYLQWPRVPTANGFVVLRSTNGGGYTPLATLGQTTYTGYWDSAVTNGSTYSYEVEATNRSGTGAPSEPASAMPMSTGALPQGWADVDVGTVQTAGSGAFATLGQGTYLVTGQGSGIGGVNGSYTSTNPSTSDAFNYAFTQVKGDFTLTARLASVAGKKMSNTGIMMRAGLDTGAQAVTVVLGSIGRRIGEMGARPTAAGSMSWINGNQYTGMPTWLRLRRTGDAFTAYQSADGVRWFKVGTMTVAMPATYYVGLAACSGDTSASATVETSTFDHVDLDPMNRQSR